MYITRTSSNVKIVEPSTILAVCCKSSESAEYSFNATLSDYKSCGNTADGQKHRINVQSVLITEFTVKGDLDHV